MTKKITIARFCEDVAEVLEDVKECSGPVTITERSRPIAVLMGFESFLALQRRLQELEEIQLQQIVTQGRQEHKQGRTRRIKSLRELR